jgi:hypothetical protein
MRSSDQAGHIPAGRPACLCIGDHTDERRSSIPNGPRRPLMRNLGQRFAASSAVGLRSVVLPMISVSGREVRRSDSQS